MRNILLFLIISISFFGKAQNIVPGAENTALYFQDLEGKKLGLVVNQTSLIEQTHLADSLLAAGFTIKTIFAPEHGFRGDHDAGEHVASNKDKKTGLPIISLYGNNKKPTKEQLEGLDLVIFDIQDVGARFYTYISTLHYVMESCAENNVDLIVLDRPNPNGWYVDGPVLDTNFRSFVGMHPVPVVYGMSIGEYALMINNEKWINGECLLKVIPCENYDHTMRYSLPVAPSPNLPNDISINLYPSLCLFEATEVSVGRGTPMPFQQIGSPFYSEKEYSFVPESIEGKAKYPKHENKKCYGFPLTKEENSFNLEYLWKFYEDHPSEEFITSTSFFNKLAGTDAIQEALLNGESYQSLEKEWKKDLKNFLEIREKYLLYPDFE